MPSNSDPLKIGSPECSLRHIFQYVLFVNYTNENFCLKAKKVDLFKMISTLKKWQIKKSLKELLQSIKKKAIGINIAGIFRNSEIDRKNEILTTFIKLDLVE